VQRDQVRFTTGGKTYEYRGYLGAADALLIKQHAGLTASSLFTGLVMGDPGALVALVFLAKRQSGETVAWAEVVQSLDGEDDLHALIASIEPIVDSEPAPATKAERKTSTRKSKATESPVDAASSTD
jgi:hypothetical protein